MHHSGYGSEKENLAAEKAFDEAEAKGHRPCKCLNSYRHPYSLTSANVGPSCKKMIDMSPDHIFKTAAFEPTDEELSTYARKMRKEKAHARRRADLFDVDVKMQPPSPSGSLIELSDSDDGSLPDVMSMFKKPSPVKKGKKKKKSTIYSDDVSRILVSLVEISISLTDLVRRTPQMSSLRHRNLKARKRRRLRRAKTRISSTLACLLQSGELVAASGRRQTSRMWRSLQ